MLRNPLLSSKKIDYFFTRAKNTHEENGSVFITLFARLTKEYSHSLGPNKYHKIESVWVGIEEVKAAQATEKMKTLPEDINKYHLSSEVFEELLYLSDACPEELYYITPIHRSERLQKSVSYG